MLVYGIFLIVFGVLVIAFPTILVWLIGGFFIFFGINVIVFYNMIKNAGKNEGGKDYVQVGEYKVYRNEK